MTITKEQAAQWARECGTPYVNRHFPDKTSYGFDEQTLLKFTQLAYEAGKSAVSEPVLTGCACRWDANDKRVETCVRHQGWLDVVSEWADRAKEAEAKPLTDAQIVAIVREASKGSAIRRDGSTSMRIARAIEKAHGIGAEE